jgi:DNA-binding transcriptional LysR family regulator
MALRTPGPLLSLAELRVLIGLARGKTLAAIGAELYLTQPSISKIVRSAEQKAGLDLVTRRGRRIRLTSTGAEVARAAQPIVLYFDELQVLLGNLREGRGGPLRLVATPSVANYILADLIGEFIESFADVDLSLRIVTPEDIWDVFINDHYDLGVSPLTHHPGGVVLQRLFEEPVVFFAAPGSPLTRQSEVEWEHVRRERLFVPLSEPHWAQLFQELNRQGLPLGRHMDLRAGIGASRLIEAGHGIGVNVASAVQRLFEEGRLQPIRVKNVSLTLPFYLIQREHVRLSPVAQRFRALVMARLGHAHAPCEYVSVETAI